LYHTSIDILSVVDQLSFVVASIILAFGAYRGVTIGRAFVNRLYRSRAIWIVAIVLVALFNSLSNLVPFLNTSFVPFILLVVTILVVFVFVDVSILATIELDFFHKNTLRWRQVRFVGYLLLFGEVGLAFLLGIVSGLPGSPSWITTLDNSPAFTDQAGLAVFGVLVYSAAALMMGARKTPDRTMKRHLQLVGFAFALFIISTLNDLTLSIDLLDDFLGVLGPYVIYLAVMALSPVGRVEKEVTSSSTLVPQVGAPA
jgi:hypothetical protein